MDTAIEGHRVYDVATSYIFGNPDLYKIWHGQRPIDEARIKEIVAYQKTLPRPIFTGTIVYCKYKDVYYLIDGQHRLEAMRILGVQYALLEVLTVKHEEDIRMQFVILNKSVPVPVYVITPSDLVESAISKLVSVYPDGFSNKRTARPKINIGIIKTILIKINIVDEYKIKSSEQLMNALLKVNTYYRNLTKAVLIEMLARTNTKEREVINRAYDKCVSGKCMFIGLFRDSSWLNELFAILNQ